MPARVWRPQLEVLGQRYRVAALDPRGQGESELPADGFNIDRRSEDLREFVARYPRVVLVAWSLGALEALHLLHRHGAGRVAALVLVDSSVGEGQAQAPAAAGTTFADELRRDRAKAVDAFVQAVFKRSLPEADLITLRDEALRLPLEASLSLFPSAIPRSHWRRAVHEFKRPLLYVVTPQFSGQATALRKNRPGTKVAVFREAGHALFADEPARFNQLLSEFLVAHGLAE
jgi:non-heme chloroperoxidase